MHFLDRIDAGRQLAAALAEYRGPDTVVYALPRGGVVVGFEVARALGAPLELVIPRKIGHPGNPEYAVCAITEAGEMICNEEERALLDRAWLAQEAQKEKKEAERRRRAYVGTRKHIAATNRRAIVVDDGIATGLTMRAAVKSVRAEHPRELIVAVPVAPHDTVQVLKKEAAAVIVLDATPPFRGAIGAYYDDFSQTTDEEVVALLTSRRR